MLLNRRVSATLFAAVSAVSVAATVAACAPAPTPPCEGPADCRFGETCVNGECLSDDGGGGNGGNGGNGGSGGDEEDVIIVDDLDGDVTMLQTDVLQGDAGFALVGEYTTGIGIDQVRRFDLQTHELSGTDDGLLFVGTPLSPCSVDALHVEPGIAPQGATDEMWISCNEGGLRRTYDDDLQQHVTGMSGEGADLVVAFERDRQLPFVGGRRAYARRGTDTLVIARIDEQDALEGPRNEDTIESPLVAIAGLFHVANEAANGQFGDVMYVFDRGDETRVPRLVALERAPGTTTWGEPDGTIQLRSIELPADVHALLLQGDALTPTDLGAANVEVPSLALIRPTLGRVDFVRLEEELRRDNTGNPQISEADLDASRFNALQFEPEGSARLPTEVPPATDRILLVDAGVASDSQIFYALTNKGAAWRLPLHRASTDDRVDEVLFARFDNAANDRPTAMVRMDAKHVWVALGNRRELHQLPFSREQ